MEPPPGFSAFAPHSSEEGQVPGRRTPLGAVGLGGFYFPGGPMPASHDPPSDENRPDSGGGHAENRLVYFKRFRRVRMFWRLDGSGS